VERRARRETVRRRRAETRRALRIVELGRTDSGDRSSVPEERGGPSPFPFPFPFPFPSSASATRATAIGTSAPRGLLWAPATDSQPHADGYAVPLHPHSVASGISSPSEASPARKLLPPLERRSRSHRPASLRRTSRSSVRASGGSDDPVLGDFEQRVPVELLHPTRSDGWTARRSRRRGSASRGRRPRSLIAAAGSFPFR